MHPTAEAGLATKLDGPVSKWGEALIVGIGSLGFAAAFAYPMLIDLGTPGVAGDWDYSLHHQWVPYETVTRFQQIPLWNPYACGGTPLLAAPQSRILTPFLLLHLAAGPVAGLHLEIVLHLAIATAGGYVLGRVLGLSRLAAVTTATVFPSCSAHYLHFGAGHMNALAYAYLPWAVAAFWRSCTTASLFPAALSALLLALMIGEGGVYAAPHAALLMGMLAVVLAVARRRSWPLAIVAIVGLLAFGLAAPKLLPLISLMRDHRRLVSSEESMSLGMLLTALFARDPSWPPAVAQWPFHEYGAYLGPCAAALGLIGIVRHRACAGPWVVSGSAFLLLALGNVGVFAPWPWLHRLPVFASQHVPSRFLVPFAFTVSVLAGCGADALIRRRASLGAVAAAFLTVASLLDAFFVGPRHLRAAFAEIERPSRPSTAFRQVQVMYDQNMFALAKANKGMLDCYEIVHLDRAANASNRPGYRGEEYLTGPGIVQLARWTPNELEYDVDLPQPVDLVVNQNFDPAWHLAKGTGDVFSLQGLLAVHLASGRQHLVLRYRSPSFVYGVGLALASIAAFPAIWCREGARPGTAAVSRDRVSG